MRRDHRFSVGEHPRLEIDIPAGRIRVEPGDSGVVVVTVDANDPEQVEVGQFGDSVTVRQLSRWGFNKVVQVIAEIPRGSDLTIVTASGDVRVRGSLAAVRVRTASGAVEIDEAERADLNVTSGDIRIGRVSGAAAISATSGDVTLGSVGGRLNASLTSGDFRLDLADGSVDVGSTSGLLQLRRCNGDDITVKTVSGDVRIGLPAGTRVEPDISTLSGRTTLPPPGGSSAGGAGEAKRHVRLRVRTVSGDIRIDRV